MPTLKQVGECLLKRMGQDEEVRKRLEQAGSLWAEVPFQFYYGNNNDVIDIVVADAERDAIAPLDLPQNVWKALLNSIGPTTLVKKAINTMWLASFSAQ